MNINPRNTIQRNGNRVIAWTVLGLLQLVSMVGCVHMPVCKGQKILTQEAALRREWSNIQRLKERKAVASSVIRFLDRLLGGTPFYLKEARQSFVVVDRNDTGRWCKVDVSAQQRQLRDEEFLQKLYQIQERYRLTLKVYGYQKPEQYTVSHAATKVSAGDCQSKAFWQKLMNWHILSMKDTMRATTKACIQGQNFKAWRICMPYDIRKAFNRALKRVCRPRTFVMPRKG